LLTDLVQIKRQGEKKREENLRFRRWLKSHTFVERQFRRAAEEVYDAIDCRACAQCCRVTEVELTERDIEHLARHLGASRPRFLDEYTMTSEDGTLILKRTDKDGCIFLSGNDCTVYEARPADCDRFPHLLRGAGSLESRMWKMPDRATFCPIVYNWLEKVKALTSFR
jgi:Fe-S-cluster containining protein